MFGCRYIGKVERGPKGAAAATWTNELRALVSPHFVACLTLGNAYASAVAGTDWIWTLIGTFSKVLRKVSGVWRGDEPIESFLD